MIKRIDMANLKLALEVLCIQIPSYMVEAEIIETYDIPPLKDSVLTLQQCNEHFYGYYKDKKLCGVISIQVENNEVNICRLIVHPNHFKKGIAQSLFTFIEHEYERTVMKVATATKNIPAVHFYKKHGFEMTNEIVVSGQLSLSFFIKRNNHI